MSPDTHQQYALLEYYQTEGWKLLKVDPKTKGGVDAQWQLREAPIKDVRRYLDNGGGVGIQLGEVSNWLAVADADNEYAVKLAPAFLPDTLKQAKGNEVSHFFFYSENLGYEQFNDLNGNRLIDVKASNNGAGHLVVVEPSPHPTKGSYSFVSGFNPAAIVHVDAAVLRHRIALWACSSLIALHLPKTREEGEGNRHDISNAIAGFGLRNGWAEEEAAKVLVEAWRVRQAPHGAVRDIARNVESTAWKIRNNEPATGGRKLEELVPGLAGRIAKFMGWERAQLDTSAAPDIGEIGITKALADAVTETEYFAVDIGERLYRYNDGAYRSGGERFIKRRTKELLEQWGKTKTWSSYRANEVIEFLKADARELWLKPPPDEINVQNGILDLSTRKLKDHSPEFLSAVQIPVRYDPAARCEAWEKYIVPCFPSDAPELPYEILANIVAPY